MKPLLIETETISILYEPPNVLQSFKKVIGTYPMLISVLPMLVIDGLCLGVYSSEITHLIPRNTPF